MSVWRDCGHSCYERQVGKTLRLCVNYENGGWVSRVITGCNTVKAIDVRDTSDAAQKWCEKKAIALLEEAMRDLKGETA